MSDSDADSVTVRASPGTAAAQAIPDASVMRNHADMDSGTRQGAHGD